MTDHTPTVAEMREYISRLQGTGGSLSRALSESVGEWFDRGIAQVKAEAFAEGAWAQVQTLEFQRGATVPIPANPYRSEE